MKVLLITLCTLSIAGLVTVSGMVLCGCPPYNEPVCASDGKTYPNKCTMGCEQRNLYVLYNGPCIVKPQPAVIVTPIHSNTPPAPIVTPITNYSPPAPVVTPIGSSYRPPTPNVVPYYTTPLLY